MRSKVTPFWGFAIVPSGDFQEQFVAHLTSCQDSLYAYILSLLPNEDVARDVLQETNIVLWRKADEFNRTMSFIAWACGIARFQVKAARRDMQRRKLIFDDDLLGDLAVEAERFATNDTFGKLLLECLDELPAGQRALVVERYLPGATLKGLARRLGRSISGLGVSLFRIRQLLAKCLESKIASEDRS
jgi:RNA polymerase sigma-70 factor, ECF subfamily